MQSAFGPVVYAFFILVLIPDVLVRPSVLPNTPGGFPGLVSVSFWSSRVSSGQESALKTLTEGKCRYGSPAYQIMCYWSIACMCYWSIAWLEPIITLVLFTAADATRTFLCNHPYLHPIFLHHVCSSQPLLRFSRHRLHCLLSL